MRQIEGFKGKYLPKEVRLIGADGSQIGIVSVREAQEKAREAGLDLVGVNERSKPPVCKIMDYGKFKYEQKKAAKESRKKQHTVDNKEIKVRPNIGDNDLNIKIKKIKELLGEGCRVKITVQFRGREMAHTENGFTIISYVLQELEGIGELDSKANKEGRTVFAYVKPVKA